MPQISIIVPVYNGERVISACLESILSQTFTDYEILVIDGGSSDETMNVVKKYSDKSNCIKWTSGEDLGVYDAMNKGIKWAKGEWVYFLGCDDLLNDSEVLSNISKYIERNKGKYDIIYGNVFSSLFGGKYDGEFNIVKLTNKNICHQAIFYNKQVFEQLGYYNLRYSILADYEFNLRCFLNKEINAKYVDLMIAQYSDGGISSINHSDKEFLSDYHKIIMRYGFKTLPLLELKRHCSSNSEFALLLTKRLFSF